MTITRVELLAYAWPHVELEIDCGSGTYMRSIARDVGRTLGCGGLIEVLTRKRIGPFTIGEAIGPTALDRAAILGHLRPTTEAVSGMPHVVLEESQIRSMGQGQAVEVEPDAPSGEVAVLDESGELVAIAESVDGGRRLAPRRVLRGVRGPGRHGRELWP